MLWNSLRNTLTVLSPRGKLRRLMFWQIMPSKARRRRSASREERWLRRGGAAGGGGLMPRLKFSQRHFVVLMYRQSVDVFLLSVVGVSFLAFSGRRLLFVMYWLVAGWLTCVRTWDWPALVGVCMPSTPPSPWVVYWQNSQIGPQTISRGSTSSSNFEKVQFGPPTSQKRVNSVPRPR